MSSISSTGKNLVPLTIFCVEEIGSSSVTFLTIPYDSSFHFWRNTSINGKPFRVGIFSVQVEVNSISSESKKRKFVIRNN